MLFRIVGIELFLREDELALSDFVRVAHKSLLAAAP